jgi:hypothetical protein
MYRLELSRLIYDKSTINDLLIISKNQFSYDKTIESFNKMQELSKRYQDLNNKIYTYDSIIFYYSMLANKDKYNVLWEPFKSKNINDVILDISYTCPFETTLSMIILSESKTGLPTFKVTEFENHWYDDSFIELVENKKLF